MGVKALTFSGGGEPLTYPHILEAVRLVKEQGIDLKKDVSKGKESRIEWNIHDDFGRTFQGPFLTLSEKNEIFTIKRSLFPSVERMIAIILELHEKDLSQKKELLSKMGIFANLRIHELEN